ncbi:MAG: flagellar export protein FliJ [Rhodoferax sp.]|nr:flagellar export protein FliJ [Rhodoferax sp.]
MTAVASVQLATDLAARRRDEAGLDLARVQRGQRFAQDQLEQLDAYAAETLARWSASAQVSATPELMRHHYQFMERLHHAIGLQRGVVAKAALEVEAANLVLLQAEFRLAALKQVLARKQAEAVARQAKREQKQMDEFAALQFARMVRSLNVGDQP